MIKALHPYRPMARASLNPFLSSQDSPCDLLSQWCVLSLSRSACLWPKLDSIYLTVFLISHGTSPAINTAPLSSFQDWLTVKAYELHVL